MQPAGHAQVTEAGLLPLAETQLLVKETNKGKGES